jgi:hypothetical protein
MGDSFADIVTPSFPFADFGLELWFATKSTILGFNEYAQTVRAYGEMSLVFGPRFKEK